MVLASRTLRAGVDIAAESEKDESERARRTRARERRTRASEAHRLSFGLHRSREVEKKLCGAASEQRGEREREKKKPDLDDQHPAHTLLYRARPLLTSNTRKKQR